MGLELHPRAKISVTSDEMTSAAGQAGQVSRPYCLAVQCFRRSGEHRNVPKGHFPLAIKAVLFFY